jgi:hypothetical protein
MGHKPPYEVQCRSCGIPQSDGYCEDCPQCQDRRLNRIARGQLVTPTGYAGEGIDNTHRKGVLIAWHEAV